MPVCTLTSAKLTDRQRRTNKADESRFKSGSWLCVENNPEFGVGCLCHLHKYTRRVEYVLIGFTGATTSQEWRRTENKHGAWLLVQFDLWSEEKVWAWVSQREDLCMYSMDQSVCVYAYLYMPSDRQGWCNVCETFFQTSSNNPVWIFLALMHHSRVFDLYPAAFHTHTHARCSTCFDWVMLWWHSLKRL